jgi:DNA polymerase III delta prime subunit
MDPPFVTIKFDRQLDLARLGNTGLIGVEFNPTQHHIRQQAIEALRNQTASNNRLLHVFVDHDYLPFKPGDFARLDSLNEPQQEVVRSGLTVPDMFRVMGPPGTGKTHTIAALVTELVRKEKKVLITSKNNPAVDNVLVELKGMTVVRVGHEIRVADGAQSLLIDNQARALQQRITAGTAASLQTYQTLVRQWRELEADVDGLRCPHGASDCGSARWLMTLSVPRSMRCGTSTSTRSQRPTRRCNVHIAGPIGGHGAPTAPGSYWRHVPGCAPRYCLA